MARWENQTLRPIHSIWDGVMLVPQVLHLKAVAIKIFGVLYELVHVVIWLWFKMWYREGGSW
jgi:hypothetical protein